jgi:hypothetical protein
MLAPNRIASGICIYEAVVAAAGCFILRVIE